MEPHASPAYNVVWGCDLKCHNESKVEASHIFVTLHFHQEGSSTLTLKVESVASLVILPRGDLGAGQPPGAGTHDCDLAAPRNGEDPGWRRGLSFCGWCGGDSQQNGRLKWPNRQPPLTNRPISGPPKNDSRFKECFYKCKNVFLVPKHNYRQNKLLRAKRALKIRLLCRVYFYSQFLSVGHDPSRIEPLDGNPIAQLIFGGCFRSKTSE